MLANDIGTETVIRYWYLFPTCFYASAIKVFKKMIVYGFIADHKSLTHQCYIS